MSGEKLFYIQDTRGFYGDSVRWWRPNGNGYTGDIDEAGLYSEEEVDRRLGKNIEGIHKPWPKELVERCISRHVLIGTLMDAEKEES